VIHADAAPGDGYDTTRITIHDNSVPDDASHTLDRLYGSIYSSLDHFQVGEELDGVSSWVSWRYGKIRSLLLYRRTDRRVHVLNQLVRLDADELQQFAATLFERDASLSTIVLTAVKTDTRRLRYPVQRHVFTEDIVADLPASCERFTANLGRNMRETVNRHMRRLQRAHPTFRFESKVDGDIDTESARALFHLHQARMIAKSKRSDIDEAEFGRILGVLRRRGLMTIATIDGRICGGLMCWRAGSEYFMRIIAHDPAWDDYRLGTLCCWLTMKQCIAMGGTRFHFLFGRNEYKYRFLGVGHRYDMLMVYRSRAAMLRHPASACAMAWQGLNREARTWLLDVRRWRTGRKERS
jgi:hypothetical protein